MEPLTAGNSRVKEARKLSRRSVRTERRLFLADGPKAVEGALGRPDCVVEVFATPAASTTYAALLADARLVTLVDERALAALSDAVTPAGVVALCRHLDVPLSSVVEDVASSVVGASLATPPRHLRRRPRPRQRRHRDPHRRCRRSRRGDPGRPVGRPAQPEDDPRQRGQRLPPADRARARPRRCGRRRPGGRLHGAGRRRCRRARPVRRQTCPVPPPGSSATRRGGCPRTWLRWPITGSPSRSTAAPRASTSRRPRRCACSPAPAPTTSREERGAEQPRPVSPRG